MNNDVKAILAAGLFIMLGIGALQPSFATRSVSPPGCVPASAPGCWGNAPQGGDAINGVAAFIFGPYALPFEVLSLVLLVALVGALAMARLERPGEEGGEVE